MRKSMYKIQDDYINILSQVEAGEGELTPDLEKDLKINEEEKEAKALAYIQFIEEEGVFIERVKKEINRLKEIQKRSQNLVDRLKENLVNSVSLFGEYNTGFYSVNTRTSKSVNILEESSIPDVYKTKYETLKVDKGAIKKAIESGESVYGAEVVESKNISIGKIKR